MPLEILTGPEVSALLARAQQRIGEDAVVLSVKRVSENGRRVFEMVASDPVTAERQRRETQKAQGRAEAALGHDRIEPSRRPRTPAAPDAPEGFWNLDRSPAPSVTGRPSAPAPAAAPASAPVKPARRRFGWPFAVAPARAGRRSHVVVLVGPTGAGKTTTIAKLANHPQAFAGRRVGLLCLDTYRIGGVEQARQYAELSRLPFEVVWDAKEIARAVHRLRDCEVVLVDTPGRGPRAAGDLRETQARLLELAPDEVHLALPAGLQRSLAHRVVTAHLPLGVTHLLPTKLDEYPDERGVFELARQFALPMRWIADGQEVPRDLQVAPETPGVARASLLAAEAV
jgi:flagellar biosynthesis protein FlhF